MSRIRPTWTPANTDESGDFTIGHRWSSSAPVTVDGAWYYRGTGTNPPTGLTALLYDLDTETVLASGTAGAPDEGWSFVAFTSPYEASAEVDYVTAVETDGRYGFELDADFPLTDPDHGLVTIPSNGGAFEFGHVFPGSFWEGMHGTDTEFEPTAADPNEGTAALGLGLQLAAAGARDSAGAAAYGLGLQLQAAGSRPSQGQAHFVLGLALAAAGQVSSVTPGTTTAGGTAPTLTAGGTAPTLTAGGTAPTLTAGGTP